jgi:hypothetical protein
MIPAAIIQYEIPAQYGFPVARCTISNTSDVARSPSGNTMSI